jgi:flagellar hook-associated protein 1 FlgK
MGLLDLGSGALAAQNAGIAIVGRNTANVNTPGYSRESVNFNSELGSPLIGGVMIGGVSRAGSNLLAGRERLVDSDRGQSGSLSQALLGLESDLTPAHGSVMDSIAGMFGNILDVASAPFDLSLRQGVVNGAQATSTSFADAAASISRSQADADSRLTDQATQASSLAAQIAAANHAMAGPNPDPTLLDMRDLAARKLSEITGGEARIDPDGKMRFVLGGGTVLVDGDHASTVTAAMDSAYGNHVRIDVVDGTHKVDVTRSLTGGSMGGDLAFRDGAAAQAAQDLDQLAYDVSTKMNAVHRANAGQDGTTGRNLFVEPTQVAGAAAAMAVDPTVAADPTKVAVAGPGAGAGDNTGALALAALKDQNLAGGGARTFVDEAIRSVGTVGGAAATARSTFSVAQARTDALASVRDSLSGVSQDEEMAKLAQFQHAHEAAAKFVGVINTLLDNLITQL